MERGKSMKFIKMLSLILIMLAVMSLGVWAIWERSISDDVGKIQIVCTVYPVYDWVKEITEDVDNVEIYLLADNGIDLHNYTPTVSDIVKINESDLFIYIDGDSDSWVKDAMDEDLNSIALIWEIDELILSEHDHDEDCTDEDCDHEDHDHEEEDHVHDEDCDHDHSQYDEHIWMSVKNAKELVAAISKEIIKIDEENRVKYEENTTKYEEVLEELIEKYEVLNDIAKKVIIVAGRNPYNYLVRDYAIECFAAYEGCSAEYEVNFETVIELAEIANEHNIKTLIIEEGGNRDVAESIITNSGATGVMEINSMETVNLKDEYKTYVEIAEENLEKLLELLK